MVVRAWTTRDPEPLQIAADGLNGSLLGCSKRQAQTEANDVRRHAQAKTSNTDRSPVLRGLQPERHALGCLNGDLSWGMPLNQVQSHLDEVQPAKNTPPITVFSSRCFSKPVDSFKSHLRAEQTW